MLLFFNSNCSFDFLASFFRNVISTWSSGTGGAGITGSLSYAVMIGAGLTPKTTLLLMLISPVLEATAFWGLLRHNNHIIVDEKEEIASRRTTPAQGALTEKERLDMEQSAAAGELEPLTGFKSKMRYVPKLLIYMVPLTLVYLLEYFINQGLVILFAIQVSTEDQRIFEDGILIDNSNQSSRLILFDQLPQYIQQN